MKNGPILSGALAAAFCFAADAARAEDGTIVTASNKSIPARDITLAVENGSLIVRYLGTGGGKRSLKAADVVEIMLGRNRLTPNSRPEKEDVEITLTTGDVVVGKVGAASEKGVNLRSKVLADPLIPFGNIHHLVFVTNRQYLPKRPPGTPAVHDVVYLKSGDRAKATVLTLSTAGLTYYSETFGAERSPKLGEVAGFWLTPTDKAAPKEPETLFATVLTARGSSIRGTIESLAEGILVLKDLYGTRRKIAADSVAGLYMKNGRVVYLSDMEPSEIQEDANFIRGVKKSQSDLEYPYKRDRSARGTKLMLGGTQYRKGLGVRAHSSLTYPLDGAYKRFQTTFGLDEVSRGLGAVAAEVWVDGKKIRSLSMKGRQRPEALDIDVSGARKLRLIVTWAGNGQSDFADWGSARLIR